MTDATTAADTTSREATPTERVSVYEQLGGAPAIRQLVETFYDDIERAPEAAALRRMHAADLGPMRQTLFEFLSGWLGGPRTYWDRTNAKCMMSVHASMPISQADADQWMRCMQHALNGLTADASARAYVTNAFTKVCNAMVKRPLPAA